MEFSVPSAAALKEVARQVQERRVATLCASARKRKGDGEKWAEDMLRVVGESPAGPAPERTDEERKQFARVRSSLVMSPGPLRLFTAEDVPDGPLRVIYPCTWHDAPCRTGLRGVAGMQLTRGQSLWRLARKELPPVQDGELPLLSGE
jgi:hypothetical protein